jgi:hypothetical protein
MPRTDYAGPYATPEELGNEVIRAKSTEATLLEQLALQDARLKALEAPVPPTPPVDPIEQLFVDPTGSNTNNGDKDHPFRDVNEALKHLGPNVAVNIRAGLYLEEIVSPQGGVEGALAIVRAYQGEFVTLQPPAGRARCITLADKRSAFIRWEALHLDGRFVGYDVVKLTYSGTDPLNAAHHVTFLNCEMKGAKSQGLLITHESHHNVMEGGSIHDCGLQTPLPPGVPTSDLVHGFYLAGSDNVLRGVEVYRCAGSAGQVYTQINGADRNLIDTCYFHDCALGGPQRRPMLSMGPGTGSRIVNPRFVGGVYASRGVDFMGSTVENEIVGGYLSGFPEIALLIEPGAQRTKVTQVAYGTNGKNYVDQGTGSIITPITP